MKNVVAIAVVFVAIVALFTAIYYGRIHGVAVCKSDGVLFGVSWLLALWAYAVPFGSIFRTRGIVSCVVWVILTAFLSTIAGMWVAFNLMGT